MDKPEIFSIAFFTLVILTLLVWGVAGGIQTSKENIACDKGLGENGDLCWSWSQNSLELINEDVSTKNEVSIASKENPLSGNLSPTENCLL